MNPNKAPGADGISALIYRSLNDQQTQLLTDTLNQAINDGFLPVPWKEGVISTLFKKGDVTRIENRRPITLLKVDYKILSKILTTRLLKVFPELISNF